MVNTGTQEQATSSSRHQLEKCFDYNNGWFVVTSTFVCVSRKITPRFLVMSLIIRLLFLMLGLSCPWDLVTQPHHTINPDSQTQVTVPGIKRLGVNSVQETDSHLMDLGKTRIRVERLASL